MAGRGRLRGGVGSVLGVNGGCAALGGWRLEIGGCLVEVVAVAVGCWLGCGGAAVWWVSGVYVGWWIALLMMSGDVSIDAPARGGGIPGWNDLEGEKA